MPAKLLKSFASENPDLEKQIGCVAGIFQMFDRHIFFARQRPNRHKHKKFPPDHALRDSSRHESESIPYMSEILQEKNLAKYWYENEKASMESSRASCSSASSSSFSSLEFDKLSHRDMCSFDKTFFSERTLRNSSSFRSSEVDCKFDSRISGPSAKSCRRSSDLLDTLREAEVFTVRTSTTDKVKNQAYKHQDSPRPSWHTATNKPTNLDEAIRLLIEFKKAPWSSADREATDASITQVLQDERGLSKSTEKMREFPRLSLDSRQASQRSTSSIVSKTSLTFEDLDKANKSPRINRAANLLQNLSSSQKRHPGVVAKLMGIEDMPELNSPAQVAVMRRTMKEKNDLVSQSNRSRESIVSKPPEDHHHSLLKQSARVLNEAAPWVLHEQMPTSKDLKAFRHMVDAIRAQRLAKNTIPKGNNQNVRSPKVRKQPTKAGDTPKSFEPPIVIMKPAKAINRADASSDSVMRLEGLSTLPKLHTSTRRKGYASIPADRELSPRVTDNQFSRKSTTSNNSPRCQSNSPQLQGENLGASPRTSSARSPRSPQRKIEAEKKPCSPTSRKPLESVSPRGRLRPKQSQERKNRDQVDEIISERRIASCRADETSLDLNRSSVSALHLTLLQKNILPLCLNKKQSVVCMHQDASERELASIAPKQPSPVSVLDASFCQDEFLPSPLKKSSYTVQGKSTTISSNQDTSSTDNGPCASSLLTYPSENKLGDTEKLAQLKVLSSNEHEEQQACDFISTKCNLQNPDNKYISDILLAAGFLRKEIAIPSQKHINLDIFRVVEKRHGHQNPDAERIHRKLVFDVVREILAHKRGGLACRNPSEFFLRGRRTLSGQQLLGEICSEIKELEEAGSSRSTTFEDGVELISNEDILGRSEGWEDSGMEKIRVGMQIERLILQDLINEIVGEAGFQTQRTNICS
ncbi:hypothetical protein ZIOFF_023782 [Zingiber officinale]|uniref:DUF4378 domain-containing protein n=1 Tax=Zingiber officinale TaxID=94328 RepID=A0A8J5LFR3_ZINOF|nr:hypothetical protein ZIOFF_023782 [Zingiber officinale]